MGSCYIPPAYKPRLFPRMVRWGLTGLACITVLVISIGAMWVADAINHVGFQ